MRERGERWIDDESVVAFEHAGWGLNQILDTRKGSRNICDLILSLSGFSKILRPPTTFEFISIYSLSVFCTYTYVYIYPLPSYNSCDSQLMFLYFSLFIYTRLVTQPNPFVFVFPFVLFSSAINIINCLQLCLLVYLVHVCVLVLLGIVIGSSTLLLPFTTHKREETVPFIPLLIY